MTNKLQTARKEQYIAAMAMRKSNQSPNDNSGQGPMVGNLNSLGIP
jgi:hypothetical protein